MMKDIAVLVTRLAVRATALCACIRAAGGQPILLPTLVIAPLRPAMPTAPADVYVFLSPHAVEYGVPFLRSQNVDVNRAVIFAVGQATAQALRGVGCVGIRTPPEAESSSEGLLTMACLQAGQLQGRRVILVCGTGGRSLLLEKLQARGAQVARLEVYRRDPANSDIAAVIRAAGRRPDVTVVTSVEGMENLANLIRAQEQTWLFAVPLVTMSERIARERQHCGFVATAHVAPTADDDGIVAALIAYAAACNPVKKS